LQNIDLATRFVGQSRALCVIEFALEAQNTRASRPKRTSARAAWSGHPLRSPYMRRVIAVQAPRAAHVG